MNSKTRVVPSLFEHPSSRLLGKKPFSASVMVPLTNAVRSLLQSHTIVVTFGLILHKQRTIWAEAVKRQIIQANPFVQTPFHQTEGRQQSSQGEQVDMFPHVVGCSEESLRRQHAERDRRASLFFVCWVRSPSLLRSWCL